MLCLGLFVFSLDTLSYTELQRRSSWRHTSQDLVGARCASQYVGPGEDTITLNGMAVPEFAGQPASLAVLRLMADQGAAWVLVEGTGTIYGAFVITEISETKTLFFQNGEARRIEFSITLKRVDNDADQTAQQMLADSMGDLGSLLQNAASNMGEALGVSLDAMPSA